jgi:polyisoprenoid-binding protein YceI
MSMTPWRIGALLGAALFAGGARAEPVSYTVEPTHTFINFEVRHFGTSTSRGRWNKMDGQIVLDRAAKTGKAAITFDLASVDTGVPRLDEHLKGKDFFDTAANPSGYFVSEKFTFDGDKVATVTGELNFRGRSNVVTLKATNFNCYNSPALKKEVCGGDFETTLKRTDWGMTYLVPFVSDEVRVLVQIEAVRQ